jgi:membrane associated rhomboid family serine protease
MGDLNIDKKEFTRALYFPLLLLFLLWSVKLLEILAGYSFDWLGINPHKLSGLKGIIFAPLVHGDFTHLFNNSVPLTILTVALLYFYKTLAFRILFFIWIASGLGVWIFGRDAYYHIGASGIIYGLASFLFFSGLIRMHVKLLAISLLVIFLYGSLVWGIFPFNYDISWESHLFGGSTGFVLSLIYMHEGPQREEPDWEENEDVEDETDPYWEQTTENIEEIHDKNIH